MFLSKKPLRIGFFTSNDYFPVIGDTENVVLNAKSALEKAGHELVPFEMPPGYDMIKLISDYAYADNGVNFMNLWYAHTNYICAGYFFL